MRKTSRKTRNGTVGKNLVRGFIEITAGIAGAALFVSLVTFGLAVWQGRQARLFGADSISSKTNRSFIATTTFYGDMKPSPNNTYSVGWYGNAWKDIYASGTIYASNTLLTDGTVGAPAFSFAADTDTGIYRGGDNTLQLVRAGNLGFQVGPSLNYSYSAILPADNNQRDLGGYSLAWRDIYSSGTYYGGRFLATSSWYDATEAVTYSFAEDRDTGMRLDGVGYLGLYSNNVEIVQVSPGALYSKHSSPFSSNTYDLGSYAYNWRDIYASGTMRFGGTSATTTLDLRTGTTAKGTCVPMTDEAGVARYVYINAAGTLTVSTTNCQ